MIDQCEDIGEIMGDLEFAEGVIETMLLNGKTKKPTDIYGELHLRSDMRCLISQTHYLRLPHLH